MNNNFSLQLDEYQHGKCFLITKDNFNAFDLGQNKIIETLDFKKLLASYNNNNNKNINSGISSKTDLSEKSTPNPIKICSDVSKIDPNQVTSNFKLSSN